MQGFKALSTIGVMLILAGCVSPEYYTPAPDTHPLDEIAEFTGSGEITLVNNQPNTEEQLYHKQSKYHANYNAWTDVAITIVARELTARGFTVTENADKSIALSVDHVLTETGWTQIQSQVTLSAETESGYEGTYVGRNHSIMAANLKRQADGAVMRSVAALLNDPEITAYLTD